MPSNSESDLFPETESKTKSKQSLPISIADILKLSEEPVPWLVENLLIQGGCSLLAAKPKVGKTTLTRCLTLAVARGDHFLGQATKKSNVLLLTLEDKLSEVGRHFKMLGANESDSIALLPEAPASVSQMKKIIEAGNFGLVVIDTMILGVRGLSDLNDYLQVSQSIAPYVHLARETNAHIMFVHHLSKRERGGGDQILGSTALFGSVDAVILIDRQKQRRTLTTIMRYGTDWPISDLIFSEESKCISINAHQEVDLDEEMRLKIETFIKSKGIALSEKEIDTGVSGRTDRKRRCLRQLVEAKVIERSGLGRKGFEFLYSCSRP